MVWSIAAGTELLRETAVKYNGQALALQLLLPPKARQRGEDTANKEQHRPKNSLYKKPGVRVMR